MLPDIRSSWGSIVGDYRARCVPLALTDLAYKALTFIILTPLVGLLFRTLVATSGNDVLADQDILFFLLRPVGWLCLTAVGALWLGIVALEQAALMAVLARLGRSGGEVIAALRFATLKAWPVVQVTGRLVTATMLAVAPFLAIAGAVYFTLLTEYDINYYLQEKPPAFLVALGIGGLLSAGLTVLLLWLISGWLFALPLVLFEDVRPAEALRISRQRSAGHRRKLVLWILAWATATFLLSSLSTGAVIGLGRLIVPHTTGSLALLAVAIGMALIVWAGVGLAVNLVSTTAFATMLYHLYWKEAARKTVESVRNESAEAARGGPGFRLTRGRVLAATVVGVLAAATAGAMLMRGVRLQDDTQIMAHRGASHAAPENTMASVRQAIEEGADWVEIDVQETADGEVVVLHDSDFMKLSKVDLKIWNATLEDLEGIDVGSWFAPEFSDQRVPTLRDVLAECKGKIRVNIELKYYGHDQNLEQRVAEIVEDQSMTDDIVLMSLDMDKVRAMKSLRPAWKVGLLMSVTAGDLSRIDADFLAINASFADRRLIRRLHAQGKEVYVWTVNDAATMSAMIGRGVDCLITDRPALARAVLGRREQMSVPERLLVELAGLLGVTPRIDEQ